MTSFSKLIRYSAWNLSALILPLMVGLVSIPYLLHQIGIERFGVLTIMWAIIGYFSLFDFGISKALTKKLSEGRVNNDLQLQRNIFWTAIQIMAGLGILGALLLILLLSLDVGLIKVSAAIKTEVDRANLIIALFIPLVIVSAGLRGSLEAYEKFRLSNLVRLALGIWMFLAPAVASSLGYGTLQLMAMILVFGRIVAAIVSWNLIAHAMSGLGSPVFVRGLVRPLFAFGIWITVSGIVGPLMVYLDRFFVAASVGAIAVAYYATPQDVATKLLFLPIAINSALLPLVSKQLAFPNNEHFNVATLLMKSIWLGLVGITPFCAAMLIFPTELLTLWLGADFAKQGYLVTQFFGIGVLVNVVGIVLVSFLYASGQPSWVAKLHLIELPIYLLLLYFALGKFGFFGAACVWVLRIVVDSFFLWHFAVKLLPTLHSHQLRLFAAVTVVCMYVIVGAQVNSLTIRIFLFVLMCGSVGYVAHRQFFRHSRTELAI